MFEQPACHRVWRYTRYGSNDGELRPPGGDGSGGQDSVRSAVDGRGVLRSRCTVMRAIPNSRAIWRWAWPAVKRSRTASQRAVRRARTSKLYCLTRLIGVGGGSLDSTTASTFGSAATTYSTRRRRLRSTSSSAALTL